jgi:hypothetical protein
MRTDEMAMKVRRGFSPSFSLLSKRNRGFEIVVVWAVGVLRDMVTSRVTARKQVDADAGLKMCMRCG